MFGAQCTLYVCSATERLLLLLGWERVVRPSSHSFTKKSTAGDKAYADLKSAVHKRTATSSADSSWERERPRLRMPTVSVPVSVSTHSESNWTPDAFEVGEQTGTV